jgi:hypothetical protein
MMSLNILNIAFIIVTWLGNHTINISYVITSISGVGIILYLWFRDIIRESKEGYHT